MSLTEVLQASISNSERERAIALEFLEKTSVENWEGLLVSLSDYVAVPTNPVLCRNAAGIHFKNSLTSKNETTYKNICNRWMTLSSDSRNKIKQNLLKGLKSITVKSTFISQCISSVVAIEFPRREWFDLLEILLENITNTNNHVAVKFTVLECVDFFCQDTVSYVLEPVSGEIFDIIITAISQNPDVNEIQLFAMRAMWSAVKFASKEFINADHRNHLMEVICKATQSSNMEICVCAMQTLVRIVSLYYHVLECYMNALFQITMAAIKSEYDELILQGIEFWSTLCDEEIDLNESVKEGKIDSVNGSKMYAMGSLECLLPLLLEKIIEEDTDVDEDDWRPSKAAGVCLMLLAIAVGNPIVPYVMDFVTKNIDHTNSINRDAALLSFGSILNGPDPSILNDYVMGIIPTILKLMNDTSPSVCDSSAWVLGRIFDFIPCVARNQNDADVLSAALLKGLSMPPSIASNCCWAISIYLKSIYQYQLDSEPQNSSNIIVIRPQNTLVSNSFDIFAKVILDTIDRPDVNVHSLRTMAFEALMALIKYHPLDRYNSVENIIGLIIQRLLRILSMKNQIQSPDDMMQFTEILSLICATLQISFTVLRSSSLIPAVEQALPLILDMLQSSKSSAVEEDVLITLSVIVSVLDKKIAPYVTKIMPLVSTGMTMLNEIQVCVASVGLIGDIARAIGPDFSPFAQPILSTFLNIINTADVSFKILASIFQTIGDISLALGTTFESFAPPVLAVALQAYSIPFIEVDDFDLIDDLNNVREACLQVYIMVIRGTYIEIKKQQGDITTLTNLVVNIVKGVQHTLSDPNCSEIFFDLVCGFYGDLATLYGTTLAQLIDINSPILFLQGRANKENENTLSSASWAYNCFLENKLIVL